ncbi:hypothetical protein PanWU01x14_233980 [Parasponia andersonii]|uniref:Uncharacterized protein n=1 Tax=Parasponia andersonii TaxID=3476 RepID=A0A2P5BJ94_PARAD|nr:hypothetical protein PanWU01x14_233980 [Parasponia andersonii]
MGINLSVGRSAKFMASWAKGYFEELVDTHRLNKAKMNNGSVPQWIGPIDHRSLKHCQSRLPHSKPYSGDVAASFDSIYLGVSVTIALFFSQKYPK